jgi:hypothetical protein
MAVGLAGPEASEHRHQQVGLEQRQSRFDSAELARNDGGSRGKSFRSKSTRYGSELAGLLRGGFTRGCPFKQSRFFLSTSKMASSSGL